MNSLSPIVFPITETTNYGPMYFKGSNFFLNNATKCIYLSCGGRLSTDTYFNSFSIEKWVKYTNVNKIFLKLSAKGIFNLKIVNSYLAFDNVISNVVKSFIVTNDMMKELIIDLTFCKKLKGIIYFEVEALENVIIKDAAYCTDVEFNLPNLALVICTFKREPYIHRFVNNFKNYHLCNNLQAFIVDNGKTLSDKDFPMNIKLIANRNYGGAGGFSRGMIEVRSFNHSAKPGKHLDFIILMDDDILVDFSVFDKLLPFLSLRKTKYNNYFFAGTMCSLDDKKIQYERYGKWCGSGFTQMSPNFDLEQKICVLKNERSDYFTFGTAGWWFSCFSTEMLTPNNLAFPCFFRGDDIEFTIRNGSNIMTLNGINVWHEPFYKKYSIVAEDYYLLRNTLVLNTLYLNWIGPISNIKYLFKRFSKSIIKYDYDSAELIIRALKDYSKGCAFFKSTNPEELNNELSKFNHKLLSMDQLVNEYVADDFIGNALNKHDKNKLAKIIRFLTFNGNLLPSMLLKNEFSVALVGYGARAINFYRMKKVLNYDLFSEKGYYTERNFKKATLLTLRFIRAAVLYKIRFEKIKKDYQCNFHDLQTQTFWEKYLGINDKNQNQNQMSL